MIYDIAASQKWQIKCICSFLITFLFWYVTATSIDLESGNTLTFWEYPKTKGEHISDFPAPVCELVWLGFGLSWPAIYRLHGYTCGPRGTDILVADERMYSSVKELTLTTRKQLFFLCCSSGNIILSQLYISDNLFVTIIVKFVKYKRATYYFIIN